ncbi:hypothetical protein EJ05DRAFT_59127 [Pseudovirgaria hyperparasitica]|uniref:Uncharacterized protein n=1 Tax=Pseudovirgaria hyperparasitica TaxID=470096 RepID=A0A6A6W3S6_9PEZI|nr:uncharacterized protein EJ05DRAFT_59127 [Pseudovirgaria hyperparasitica]KAF2757215.1 hypothetical protein EJ05DRAFT_59127 [Pseudovirgaria hyperparasitica]
MASLRISISKSTASTTSRLPTAHQPCKRLLHSTPAAHIRLRPSTRQRPSKPTPHLDDEGNPHPEDVYPDRMNMPVINIYEQPEDQSTAPQLIDRITSWDELRQKRQQAQTEEQMSQQTMRAMERKWLGKSSELSEEAMIPIRTRIATAEGDARHRAAMAALKVRVEGVPDEKDVRVERLNMRLRLAYVGANAVVQRELWKAYLLAREVPGVLRAIPEPAWDIIYYSQASLPEKYPGKERIMGLLEADLKSVGHVGPPTPGLLDSRGEEEDDDGDDDVELDRGEDEDEYNEEDLDGLSKEEMVKKLQTALEKSASGSVEGNDELTKLLNGNEDEDAEDEDWDEDEDIDSKLADAHRPTEIMTQEQMEQRIKDHNLEDVSIESMFDSLTDDQLKAFLEDPRLKEHLGEEAFEELTAAMQGKNIDTDPDYIDIRKNN